MQYKTDIARREYDGKFLVWKQVPYGEIIGSTQEEIRNVQALQVPEWVVVGIYETRGKAYRASNQSKNARRN